MLSLYICCSLQVKREEIRAQIVQRYKQTAKKDHENILKRRQIIEERKEEIENLNVKRVSLQCFTTLFYLNYLK